MLANFRVSTRRPWPSTGPSLLLCAIALFAACSDETSAPPFDAGGQPSADSGLPMGDSSLPSQDSGIPPMPDGSTGTDPREALVGDYLVEFHTVARANQAALGEVTTDSTSYGVLRIVLEDGELVGAERICHSATVQTASNGTVSTSVSDSMWNNLAPVRRTLTIDQAAGTWSSAPATRRQGWSQDAAEMPTDPATQADDFTDPDMDGRFGVATRVTGEATVIIPVTADCEYDVVSYATTSYAGALSPEGLPQSAAITAVESEAFALTAEQKGGMTPCAVEDINEGPDPVTEVDEMVLSRVSGQWLASPDACPPESEFVAALP